MTAFYGKVTFNYTYLQDVTEVSQKFSFHDKKHSLISMSTQINTEFGMYNIASFTGVKTLTCISCFKNMMLINAIRSYTFFTGSNNQLLQI